MSRPIVVTACMPASSDPWPPHRRPPPWHLRAGGGAVHSIMSGLGLAVAKRSHGPYALDPMTKIRARLVVTRRDGSERLRRRSVGMSGGERRVGVVLDTQLDRPRHCLASDVSHYLQAEV